MSGRTGRRGFTLLELMLAIVLTAVAVTIAGSALRTADIARDRVVSHRDQLEKENRLREMLTDMLRHAPTADMSNEALIRVTTAPDGASQLVFLSRGVRQPYGTGNVWRVMVSVRNGALLLDAEPIGAALGETTLHAEVAGIENMRAEFLEPATATNVASWRSDWPVERARPSVIALHFDDDASRPPLVVSLDPLASTGILAAAR